MTDNPKRAFSRLGKVHCEAVVAQVASELLAKQRSYLLLRSNLASHGDADVSIFGAWGSNLGAG
jgi:hypothetical protein